MHRAAHVLAFASGSDDVCHINGFNLHLPLLFPRLAGKEDFLYLDMLLVTCLAVIYLEPFLSRRANDH